jgi:hypothetical protein
MLDKVLDGISLPGKYRALYNCESKVADIEMFCKETKSELETPWIHSLVEGTLNPEETRLINTFKELCYTLCLRTNSIDSRTNHTLKLVFAALLTRGKISISKECNTAGGPLNLMHRTNPNIFI